MTEITLKDGEGRPVFVWKGLGFSCKHFTLVLNCRMRVQLNVRYLGGYNVTLFSSAKFTIRKKEAV